MKIVNLEQRSPEWLDWRAAGLGSSDAAAIVGMSKWTTPKELWAQKAAWYHKKPDKPGGKVDSGAMARGRRNEPRVAALYSQLYGWPTFSICCISSTHPFLKASLDGWAPRSSELLKLYAAGNYEKLEVLLEAGDRKDLAIEIKCPNRNDHDDALNDEVPAHYLPQCHHLLLVSGCPMLHYVSFNDYFPRGQQLAVVCVKADVEALEALFAAENEFWQRVIDNKPPE